MSESRPAVPAALERRLKEEAGYRCAVPRCGGTVRLEMAHIEPWAKVRSHDFENMICLCADCHWRFDKLKQIPKKSIIQFKRNLSLLSHRYTQVENQLLKYFSLAGPMQPGQFLPIHPGMIVLYTNLLQDGLVNVQPISQSGGVYIQGIEPSQALTLTDSGIDLIEAMVNAEEIE